MPEGETDNKNVVKKEENRPLTIDDFNTFTHTLDTAFKSIGDRLAQLEAKNTPQISQQQQQSKITPEAIALLSQFIKPEESTTFGTKENMQFFADVGKSDFDAFRMMQQRRLMKLLEVANKTGVTQ